jgi:uncharacterized protein YlxP (DUF503 family)
MTVATLRLDLRFHPRPTPREAKRQVAAIIEKLHRSFNVSVAAAEGGEGPDTARVLVAAAAKTRKEARETLDRVADAMIAHPRAEVVGHDFSEA